MASDCPSQPCHGSAILAPDQPAAIRGEPRRGEERERHRPRRSLAGRPRPRHDRGVDRRRLERGELGPQARDRRAECGEPSEVLQLVGILLEIEQLATRRRRTARTCSERSRHLGTLRRSSGARRRRARSTEAFPCSAPGSARSAGPSACYARSRPRAGRTSFRPCSTGTRPVERWRARYRCSTSAHGTWMPRSVRRAG